MFIPFVSSHRCIIQFANYPDIDWVSFAHAKTMPNCRSVITENIGLVINYNYKIYPNTKPRALGQFLRCSKVERYSNYLSSNLHKMNYWRPVNRMRNGCGGLVLLELGRRYSHEISHRQKSLNQQEKRKRQLPQHNSSQLPSLDRLENHHYRNISSSEKSTIATKESRLENFNDMINGDLIDNLYGVPAESSFHNHRYMEVWNDEAHPQVYNEDEDFEEDMLLNDDLDTSLEKELEDQDRNLEVDIERIATEQSSDYHILKEIQKPVVMKLRPNYMTTFVSIETTFDFPEKICSAMPKLTLNTEQISTDGINEYLNTLVLKNYGWASTHQGSIIDKTLKNLVLNRLLLLDIFLNVKSLNLLVSFFSRTKDLEMIKVTINKFSAMEIFPTTDTYNIILDCIRRLLEDGEIKKMNLYQSVVPIIHRMKRAVYMTPFNITTYRELLNLLTDPDMKLGLLRLMASRNVPMEYYQKETFEALYSAYGKPEDFQKMADLTVMLTCVDVKSPVPDYPGIFTYLIDKLLRQSFDDRTRFQDVIKLVPKNLNYATPKLIINLCYYFACHGQFWNTICCANWYAKEIIGINQYSKKNEKQQQHLLADTLWPTLIHFDDMVITLQSKNINVAASSLRMFAKCLYQTCVTENGYYLDTGRIESIEKVVTEKNTEEVGAKDVTVSDFLLTDKLTIQEGSRCSRIMTELVWEGFSQIFVTETDRSPVRKKVAALLGYIAHDNRNLEMENS